MLCCLNGDKQCACSQAEGMIVRGPQTHTRGTVHGTWMAPVMIPPPLPTAHTQLSSFSSHHAPALKHRLRLLLLLQAALAQYEWLYQQYAGLAASLGQAADISLSLDPQQHLTETRTALAAAAAAMVAQQQQRGGSAEGGAMSAGRGRSGRAVTDVTYLLGSGGVVTARDGTDVPQQVRESERVCACACVPHTRARW